MHEVTEYNVETVCGPIDDPQHSSFIYTMEGPPDLPRAAQKAAASLPDDVAITAIYLEL